MDHDDYPAQLAIARAEIELLRQRNTLLEGEVARLRVGASTAHGDLHTPLTAAATGQVDAGVQTDDINAPNAVKLKAPPSWPLNYLLNKEEHAEASASSPRKSRKRSRSPALSLSSLSSLSGSEASVQITEQPERKKKRTKAKVEVVLPPKSSKLPNVHYSDVEAIEDPKANKAVELEKPETPTEDPGPSQPKRLKPTRARAYVHIISNSNLKLKRKAVGARSDEKPADKRPTRQEFEAADLPFPGNLDVEGIKAGSELDETTARRRVEAVKVAAYTVNLDPSIRDVPITRDFMSKTYGGEEHRGCTSPSKAFLKTHPHPYSNFMYINLKHQPNGPRGAGLPGICFKKDPTEHNENLKKEHSVFIGLRKKAWLYAGQYRMEPCEPLTQSEWAAQADTFKGQWVNTLVASKWAYPARFSIAFQRDHGRKPTDAERSAAIKKKPRVRVEAHEVRQALDDGREALEMYVLKPVGYSTDFQRGIAEKWTLWAEAKLAKMGAGEEQTKSETKPTKSETKPARKPGPGRSLAISEHELSPGAGSQTDSDDKNLTEAVYVPKPTKTRGRPPAAVASEAGMT